MTFPQNQSWVGWGKVLSLDDKRVQVVVLSFCGLERERERERDMMLGHNVEEEEEGLFLFERTKT